MENKEKNPKVVVIDRREDNGVLLTRRIAERYGTEKYLSLPGTYRKIGEEAFKGNGKIERLGLPDSVLELGEYAPPSMYCNSEMHTLPAPALNPAAPTARSYHFL